MNLKDIHFNDVKLGYVETESDYQCLYCSYITNKGEIYPLDNHFYDARKAMEAHLHLNHQGPFTALLEQPKKVNNLTDSQKELMLHLYHKQNDKEISKAMNVTESTVRHQRFVLKEKAIQAKAYLALYELLESHSIVDTFLDVHHNAIQVDERFVATTRDQEKVFQDFFYSIEPLRLKSLPRKEKYKIIVFKEIHKLFEFDKSYTEMEVNHILKDIYDDYVTIRRYMIEYGFLKRHDDGSIYTKNN